MPIAVLPELTRTFARTGLVLTPWLQLVALEEQLLRRARGAFVVHWFGTSVPEDRLSLSIVIVNIDALKARYMAVRNSMQAGPSGPNLLGPLAGIAGLLVGMAGSFPGTILIAAHAGEIFDHLVGPGVGSGLLTMLFSLFGAWIVPPLVLLLGTAGSPAFLAAGLAAGVGHEPTRAVVLLLGEMAAFITAAAAFWDQLSGPRDQVRNPLLARLLRFADALAKGIAHTLGFVALVVTRIGSLLPNLIEQFGALMGLVRAVFGAVADIADGFLDTLLAPFTEGDGLVAMLQGLLARIGALPGLAMTELGTLFERVSVVLTSASNQIVSTVMAFVDDVAIRITELFEHSMVGQLIERIQRLRALIPDVTAAFAAAPPPPVDDSESALDSTLYNVLSFGLTHDIRDLINSAGNIEFPAMPQLDVPAFPELPSMPDISAIADRIGRPASLDEAALRPPETTGDSVRARMGIPPELRQRPRSAFAGERARLDAAGHPVLRLPSEAPMRLGDEQIRDLIYIAAGRVLPAALRSMAPGIRKLFDAVDAEVYDVERTPLDQPMLELEDNGRLRPVVSTLTIRSDALAPDVRAFRDLLVAELEARAYLAPTG